MRRSNTRLLGVAICLLQLGLGLSAAAGPIDQESAELPQWSAAVELPVTFDVRPGSRLYVYGHQLNSVSLSLGEDDSLRANGLPIKPLRPGPGVSPPSQEFYERFAMSVPFAQKLTAMGQTAKQAADAYYTALKAFEGCLYRQYLASRELGCDPGEAAAEAFRSMRRCDVDSLLDWEGENRVGGQTIRFSTKGRPGSTALTLRDPRAPVESAVDALKSRLPEQMSLAADLYNVLAVHPGPCLYFISYGGKVILCGHDSVALARQQLEETRSSGVSDTAALPEYMVLEILEHESAQSERGSEAELAN